MAEPQKLELTDRARRIIEQENRNIEGQLAEHRKRAQAPAEAVEAVCALINLRGRYSSITGEYFDRQDYEGIQIIDTLDEALVKAIRTLLKDFVDRYRRPPDLRALSFVSEKIASSLQPMPPYPVGYMVLGSMHAALESFQKAAETSPGFELAELEHSVAHVLLGLADRYAQTREKPLDRHHSDIQREYVVVGRMRCACGEEKYEVTLQALCTTPKGAPYDRLELRCRACGAQRTVTFDLPFFKDLEKM